jgi:tellurite methyltransferase
MAEPRSVTFFETQFQRQVRDGDFALNPFETLALEHLRGSVLDLGCGLGNLAIEAAHRGCEVTAVDGSPTGVEHVRQVVQHERLAISASVADLETWCIDREYDTIVAIGLLMFFRRERALALLADICSHVGPGGRAIVNVLTEGTSFLGMFDPSNYYLFGRDELRRAFSGWVMLVDRDDSFPAPGGTLKLFSTVIAERPHPLGSP